MNWSLLAVRLATDGRCLPKFSFKKYRKKKEGFFYIYFCVCVCVISTPSSSFRLHTQRERENNNNNELYVFVLILKWRNELLSRDDNHRNHKMSDAKKRRRSWNTTTTTTCTTFFRRIGEKDAGSLVSTIPLFCACWLPWRPDLHTTLWVFLPMANAKFTLLERKKTDDNKQSDCIIKNAGDFKKTRAISPNLLRLVWQKYSTFFHHFSLYFQKWKKCFFFFYFSIWKFWNSFQS